MAPSNKTPLNSGNFPPYLCHLLLGLAKSLGDLTRVATVPCQGGQSTEFEFRVFGSQFTLEF
jgi:hypothetical protein